MNILVFSDSHGRGSNMVEVFARQIKKPDAIVFLGDGLRDLAYCEFGDVPIFAVTGNCDTYTFYGSGNADDEIVMSLGGKRVMMTHGDRYAVKLGVARIIKAAVEKDADVVLFGHTHKPVEIYLPAGESEYGINLKKPLYLLNPGSIGAYERSFGAVEIRESGEVVLSHGEV
jgi:putative phosphoesterase